MNLENRTILDDGTVICTDAALIELIYSGSDLSAVVAAESPAVTLFNQTDAVLDTNFGTIATANEPIYSDVNWMSHWFTPEQYKNLDITAWCLDRCSNQTERSRALKELDIFREKNMISVLQHLVYMVDHWRSNNIVWGVGRGSSVCSFVLYLIGINRINPLDWDLEIEDFLK